jgi:hypothetical protein
MCSAFSAREGEAMPADHLAGKRIERTMLQIPPWVRWIAQDRSGAWWGYSAEPLRHDNGWYENEVGRYVHLGTEVPRDWENSLCAVHPPQR